MKLLLTNHSKPSKTLRFFTKNGPPKRCDPFLTFSQNSLAKALQTLVVFEPNFDHFYRARWNQLSTKR